MRENYDSSDRVAYMFVVLLLSLGLSLLGVEHWAVWVISSAALIGLTIWG